MRKFLPWISKDIINNIKYENKGVSWIMSSFSCQELYQTNVIWVNILVYNGFPQMFPPFLLHVEYPRFQPISWYVSNLTLSLSISLCLSLFDSLFCNLFVRWLLICIPATIYLKIENKKNEILPVRKDRCLEFISSYIIEFMFWIIL